MCSLLICQLIGLNLACCLGAPSLTAACIAAGPTRNGGPGPQFEKCWTTKLIVAAALPSMWPGLQLSKGAGSSEGTGNHMWTRGRGCASCFQALCGQFCCLSCSLPKWGLVALCVGSLKLPSPASRAGPGPCLSSQIGSKIGRGLFRVEHLLGLQKVLGWTWAFPRRAGKDPCRATAS